MTNLIDIARRATDQPPVALLHEPRCLAARDAEARCAACAETCPSGALTVKRLVIEGAQPYESVSPSGEAGPRIDDEACVRCGACIVACPTNALLPLLPLDDEGLLARTAAAGRAAANFAEDLQGPQGATEPNAPVAAEGAEAAQASELDFGLPSPSRRASEARRGTQPEPDGRPGAMAPDALDAPDALPTAGFACERMVQSLRLDDKRVVVVPCLAWIDASLLTHLACCGAEHIIVPLLACSPCEQASVIEAVRAAAADAQRICEAAGLKTSIEPTGIDGLRPLEAPGSADAAGELSRRNLFSQAGSSLLETAKAEAAKQMDSLAGTPDSADAEPEPDTRRWQLLDDLHAAGLPDRSVIVPRALAPRVRIDVDRCSGCAQCALFCPTEALRKVGRLPGGRTLLEFDPARCRDCGVCEATCRYSALTCEETLTVGELFALDPQEITLPKRRVLPEHRRDA